MDDLTGLIAVISIFVFMPILVVIHYVMKWKTSSSLSRDDEVMLDELYQVARRLDEQTLELSRRLDEGAGRFDAGVLGRLEAIGTALEERSRLIEESFGAQAFEAIPESPSAPTGAEHQRHRH